MIALAVVSTAYSVYTTKKNAKKQEAAIRKAKNAQDEQIADQKSAEMNERMRRARVERARLRAASAETGLAGISAADLFNDVDMQASMDMAMIRNNAGNAHAATAAEAGSRMAAVEQPDYVGAALNIASSTYGSGGWGTDSQGAYWGNQRGKG